MPRGAQPTTVTRTSAEASPPHCVTRGRGSGVVVRSVVASPAARRSPLESGCRSVCPGGSALLYAAGPAGFTR
ncbi:hypothetical protein GCM10010278_04750 [Streptomyces melanogenes]|nr:hypothetical protein GCM10010278_04750 [Streptomyces melanogenes]